MLYNRLRYCYRVLKEILFNCSFKKYYLYFKYPQYKKRGKTIYIITSPEYGNLGDHAIAESEIEYLNKRFSNYFLQEVPDSMFNKQIIGILKNLSRDDIICLIGGGNFGVLYPEIEYNRRYLISRCGKCPILMFPQSSVWGDNWYEKKQLARSAQIYEKNDKLVLMARDKRTFHLMKENFRNDIYLMPDIVLTMNKSSTLTNYNKREVLLCFRNDVEKTLSRDIIETIKQIINKKGYIIRTIDTETYKHIPRCERSKSLSDIIATFANCRCVITDRLHGMIFSTVTGTPCLAFDNSTKKVSGVANEWVNNDCIILYDPDQTINNQLEKLLTKTHFEYDSCKIISLFDELFDKYF